MAIEFSGRKVFQLYFYRRFFLALKAVFLKIARSRNFLMEDFMALRTLLL